MGKNNGSHGISLFTGRTHVEPYYTETEECRSNIIRYLMGKINGSVRIVISTSVESNKGPILNGNNNARSLYLYIDLMKKLLSILFS
jgi:hypothetical protein